MKIVICGAGQVGYGIAERLAAEQNDVSVIDSSPQLINAIGDQLDVRGFVGHGAHPDVLAARTPARSKKISLRDRLAPLLEHVRFPLIDGKALAEHVEPTGKHRRLGGASRE